MTQKQKNQLMLFATLSMFMVTALLMARNEEFIFQDKGDLSVKLDPRDSDTIIFTWRNEVEAPMAKRFEDAWREWKNQGTRVLIDLHSPGGVIAEGEQVIRIIDRMKRTHIVDTRVRARHACYSMCVPIYLQGEERYAAANARFMFHEPTVYDFFSGEEANLPQFEKEMASRQFVQRYFVSSPMDTAWREKLTSQWEGRDLFYSAQQLKDERSNIVTVLE